MKFRALIGLSLLGFWSASAHSQDVAAKIWPQQISGPACNTPPAWNEDRRYACSEAERAAWLADIRHWRDERRARTGLSSAEYSRPELAWTQSSFVQTQTMVHDRFFYDPVSRTYTVEKYLADLKSRYGGVDSVLLWHTYPNLGVDSRNAYDLFNDLPGGREAVKEMIADFHKAGVKVLFPVMVWDRGTRDQGAPDTEALTRDLAAVGADGINGDTLDGLPYAFRKASDALGHPLALEPEIGLGSDEMINYNHMTWGYWRFDFVPSVSRYKWLEPRHMVHVNDRWAHTHGDLLQSAFFNGTGYESWENVWGIWNQLPDRDAEALRRISLIERQYGRLLVSRDWEPHAPMETFGVFASKWPSDTGTETLWTIVNRNAYAVSGRQMVVPTKPGMRYYNLWTGDALTPRTDGKQTVLTFDMEPKGYAAILETAQPDDELAPFLSIMKTASVRPLASYSDQWVTATQSLVEIPKTAPVKTAPTGMVLIPAGDYTFKVGGIMIEGVNDEGVDVQYPWEASARRYHTQDMRIDAFYMDRYPVSNAQFKQFMDATHYTPADAHNLLKDWVNGTYPSGWANKPVTWVSIEDARAYAAWAGKRLPHEWEWQYAGQGQDDRTYPWGNDWIAGHVPTPDTGRDMAAAADVTAHPAGESPFGVRDMVGNVWQWTDEYRDTHTRAAIVKGGSHYKPQGSRWYFPQAYKLTEHGKYLLMAPSIDRSGAIGFRCVKDKI
ncbi:formylglycine-generating enzyme family protein [Asticcacaulis sp. 201]|uniref:formylglycine-generating enzyme family protein n=1 Tax=Asticcacaulis sp. 201 TaxID=3028787 RepID=UPI002915FB45|nr:SUMF1/EgtB/PvdO family nonheme iron enzyme [Asticcacaulis sp. 201]MDV6330818.1 SUMF1/EgtB/PvdO family nonheme iron enzyme [Asticcacaulis sp. 201]